MKTQVTSKQLGRSDRGSWLFNLMLVMIMLIILAAVLVPMTFTTRTHCSGPSSICSSNLTQIGRALKMYLADWDDTFPTNRPYLPNGKLGGIEADVKLSPLSFDQTGKPIRFKNGVNWVEGLYAYVEPVTEQNDPASIWKCPEATYPTPSTKSKTAAVTYVFNRNLVEKKERIIRTSSNLMMIRESDRLLDSDLRPTNDTTWTSKKAPISPFLAGHDKLLGETEANLHHNASHIVFADGHVKLFYGDTLPERLTKDKCWDPKTKQWYDTADAKNVNYQRIAITP